MPNTIDPFGAKAKLETKAGEYTIHRLNRLTEAGIADISKLPFSIKVLLESCLRNLDDFEVSAEDVQNVARWSCKGNDPCEVPFKVARATAANLLNSARWRRPPNGTAPPIADSTCSPSLRKKNKR